ncbi:molybdopterin molybdotransferase MoeA [bacterium]|nr:molybdopterin molybdotransferase MoeA [bacterium]
MSGPSKVFVSVAEALALIEVNLPSPGRISMPLSRAAGRVLAEEIVAKESLPAFSNSAMDGYALRAAEVAGACAENPVELPLAGEIAAGEMPPATWPTGTCLRILTGAPIPADCEGVVPVEETQEVEGGVRFYADLIATGSNIRPSGEDVKAGARLLAPGHLVGPAEIALLAAQGITELEVTRRPRVGFLATGDELLAAHEAPRPGAIRNSNTPMILAMLADLGIEGVDLGVAPDNEESLATLLASALADVDLLLTSGGVSAGRYDLVGKVLEDLGAKWVFHKIAQQPGKPLAFLTWMDKPVFGLPGNPVSGFFTFWYYVAPALRKMMGQTDAHPRHVMAKLRGEIAGKPEKSFFGRAYTRWVGDAYEAEPRPPHGSHVLSTLTDANSFIILPTGTGKLEEGAEVRVAFF